MLRAVAPAGVRTSCPTLSERRFNCSSFSLIIVGIIRLECKFSDFFFLLQIDRHPLSAGGGWKPPFHGLPTTCEECADYGASLAVSALLNASATPL